MDLFDGADVIFSYTRTQGIEDGVLVDLTEWASADKGFMGGFQCPVAVTAAAWRDIEAIPKNDVWQDVRGRAHDLLFMASLMARAIARRSPDARPVTQGLFKVIMPIRGTRKRNQIYRIHCGPGDSGEMVITIMQPQED